MILSFKPNENYDIYYKHRLTEELFPCFTLRLSHKMPAANLKGNMP